MTWIISLIITALMGSAGYEPFRDVEGHAGCFIKVGPTSTVWCLDGFRTTS